MFALGHWLKPVGLWGANEQKVGNDPKSVFASQRIRKSRPSAGLAAEFKVKSCLESECLPTLSSSCLSGGSQVC